MTFAFQESGYMAAKIDNATDAETIDRKYWWHLFKEF